MQGLRFKLRGKHNGNYITVIMVIIMVLCLGISLQGIKISESQTNTRNQPSCQVVKLSSCQVVRLSSLIPWDMLNNFCFHVYAQKCQVARLSNLIIGTC